jgi:uncharacterized protein (DUF1800 family)
MKILLTYAGWHMSNARMNRHSRPAVLVAAAGALLATIVGVQTTLNGAGAPPDDDQAIVHVLNRIGFGPRPGDIERVRQIGLRQYIEQQLHPERISDDAMTTRLKEFQTLNLSSRDIAERYEIPQVQARRTAKQEVAKSPNPDQAPSVKDAKRAAATQQRANEPLMELSMQKVVRAAYSERQLQEVLTDFWFNHFNVDARKGPERFMLTEYERDVIRPHVLGHFRDLLGATAHSSAMLFYLDNWMSADPNGPHAVAGQRPFGPNAFPRRPGLGRFPPPRPQQMQQQRKNAPRGLNENYGRELLELHTLGVDGGYTQKDVTEVARAFTGWSIANPRQGGGFRFMAQLHDEGEKIVLGHRITAGGGEHDGDEVLDLLASHPATARFISTKLVRRFVNDAPPQALVDRAADTFRETHGDLRAVMTTILTSPEFLSADAYRAKVKSPFEFMVSAVRATGADISDARPVVRSMQQLGMPLYQCQPPTGYKDTADAWVNTGALVNRMNDALALANGRMPGVWISSAPPAESVLADTMSETTRATIAKATIPPQALALALGSPEFQRR